MKKLITIIICLLILTGCKNDYSKPWNINTYDADMSYYEGLNRSGHMFVGTTVGELKRLIDEKGYGVFVFSHKFCAHCQIAMKMMNDVAEELNVYIYYIDGYSDEYPIQDTENYDILFDILFDYLKEDENNEKAFFTPHIFSIIDGKIVESYIGTTWEGLDYTKTDEKNLKDIYRNILKPFAPKNQD